MTHIDKALRAWEAAAGLPSEIEAPHAGARAALNTYARESVAMPRSIGTTLPPPVSERKTPAFAPIQPRTPIREIDPDLRARLVGGGVSSMGIEQYRRVAASLHDAQSHSGLKTVMVTSALPREGKTLTIANVALTLSESFGRRVLLVDADLRWPSVHAVFDLPNGHGLSEALASDSAEPVFVKVSDRLMLLTAGEPGPTPLAGLSSDRMANLLHRFAEQFDWVLIDTPPVGLLPDAHLLARLAGAVLMVIRAGSTPSSAIERVVAELGPECIIGTVLNRVESHRIAQAEHYERDREPAAE